MRDQARASSLKEQVDCFFERQVTQLRGDGGIELPNLPQQTISVSSNVPRCLRFFTAQQFRLHLHCVSIYEEDGRTA